MHLYNDTGRYDVTLIVSNETCADTLVMPVSIIKESPLLPLNLLTAIIANMIL